MSRDDIIRMARSVWGESAILPFADLERFAALVAEAEREECAKVCDVLYASTKRAFDHRAVAAAIRARGTP